MTWFYTESELLDVPIVGFARFGALRYKIQACESSVVAEVCAANPGQHMFLWGRWGNIFKFFLLCGWAIFFMLGRRGATYSGSVAGSKYSSYATVRETRLEVSMLALRSQVTGFIHDQLSTEKRANGAVSQGIHVG